MSTRRVIAWIFWLALLSSHGASCGGRAVDSKPSVVAVASPASASSVPPAASSAVVVSAPPPPPPHVVELPGVDTSQLLTSEKVRFTELVESVLSPCGEPITLDVCVREARPCKRCLPAAQAIAHVIGQGEDRETIRTWLDHRFGDGAVKTIAYGQSPTLGPEKAPLQLVEWLDFECPACGHVAPILHKLVDDPEFAGKLHLVFKNMPLKIHEHSDVAARAGFAAQQQGKFWPMHDLMIGNQDSLDEPSLEGFAKKLGLDLGRFKADSNSQKAKDRVAKDYQQAIDLGAVGTPTIFIDGRKFSAIGSDDFEDMMRTWLRTELAIKP